jgi:type I restriction enzyme S subunit
MTIKLAPAVRFPGFTDVWEQRKLGDVVKNIGTGNSKFQIQEKSSDASYAILGSTSVIGYDNNFDFEGNFVLTARVGANAGTLYQHSGKVKISDNTVYIQSDNLSFLYNLLNRFDLKKLSFGTGQPLVKSSELKKLALNFPNKEEQEKIGNFFNQLDYTIALHQRELDNLKITKQVFMKKMFPKEGEKVPEVRFPGFMADWDYRKLGDVGETYTGLSGKSKDDFGHGRGKYVTYMNVFSNSIANPSLVELVEIDTKQNEVNPGDIFFTTSSETPEEVGMSSVWLENSDNTYLNSFCFGYRPIEKFDNYYLAYMLRSSVVRKKITFLAQGISRYNISKNKVMDIAVPIPVIEEQTKIGEFFKQLDDIINLQQQELEKLKQTKQAFLQKMFI